MNGYDADLVVVGGGPAGSSAARRGAMKGLKTILVEKKQMPRMKLCGGALSARAMGYLGFDVPSGLFDWECWGARLHFRGETLTSRLDERIAVLVSRERFDHFLLDKALETGVKLRISEALAFEEDPGGIRVRLSDGEIRARCLIVAEGASGSLSAAVREPDGPDRSGICLEHRFEVSTPDRFSDLEGLIDVYYDIGSFGYGWLFHHGRFYSVGIGGIRSTLKDPVGLFHSFCRRLGLDSTAVKPSGHFIPCGGFNRKTVKGRVILAGDSAGFVDAFYGEGIAFAVLSGQLAADVLAECVRAGGFSAERLASYPLLCESEFGRHLRGSLRLAKLMHLFPGVFLRILATNPVVLKRYLEVVLGRRSYQWYLGWVASRAPLFLARSFLKRG